MNNIKVLLHALVEGKIGSLQVQGRDKLQDNWVSGVVTVDTKKFLKLLTKMEIAKHILRRLKNTTTIHCSMSLIWDTFKLDVDSDPVAALGSAQQVT